MAAYYFMSRCGPELDAFNKILANLKVGSDDRQKLHNLFVSVFNQRNKLKDLIAAVEEEGYVVVIGEEDLRRQLYESREQLKLLQIMADSYKDDFAEERDARATVHGEKEELKISLEKLERENQQFKQQWNAQHGANPQQRMVNGTQQRLEEELDSVCMKLAESNSLNDKQREEIDRLRREVARLKPQDQEFQDSDNSWLVQSAGQMHLSQSFEGGNGPNASHGHRPPQGHPLPAPIPVYRQPDTQYSGPYAHRNPANFPQGTHTYHKANEELPLRAKDPPVVKAYSGGIPISQPGNQHYSHSSRHELGRSPVYTKPPPPLRSACISPGVRSPSRKNFAQIPDPQPPMPVPPPPEPAPEVPPSQHQLGRSWSQDDQVHHGYPGAQPGHSNVASNANTSGTGSRNPQLQASAPSYPQDVSTIHHHHHHETFAGSSGYPQSSAQGSGRVSPHLPNPGMQAPPILPHSTFASSSEYPQSSAQGSGRVSPHMPNPGIQAPPIPPHSRTQNQAGAYRVDSNLQTGGLHSSSTVVISQRNQWGMQTVGQTNPPTPRPPEPGAYTDPGRYIPSDLSNSDSPQAPRRPPRRTDEMEGLDGRNLSCPVCERMFRADQLEGHTRECIRLRMQELN